MRPDGRKSTELPQRKTRSLHSESAEKKLLKDKGRTQSGCGLRHFPAQNSKPKAQCSRSAICSVTICVRSGFTSPCSRALNSSTLLDQFILHNFGPHMLQNAASLQ